MTDSIYVVIGSGAESGYWWVEGIFSDKDDAYQFAKRTEPTSGREYQLDIETITPGQYRIYMKFTTPNPIKNDE